MPQNSRWYQVDLAKKFTSQSSLQISDHFGVYFWVLSEQRTKDELKKANAKVTQGKKGPKKNSKKSVLEQDDAAAAVINRGDQEGVYVRPYIESNIFTEVPVCPETEGKVSKLVSIRKQ